MTAPKNSDEYFAGSAYKCKSKKTLVDYHQASCWSRTHSVWVKTITKNFFISWPGLSVDLVHKHLMERQSTILGHLQQPWKGLISTQDKVIHLDPDLEYDQLPQSTQPENTNLLFFKTVDISRKFIQIKQEGSQLLQARVISISSSLTILTQIQFTMNPSRQD